MTAVRHRFSVLTTVACASALTAACATPAATRDITLIAKGMTFILPADPATANPVIQLRAGERIRLVLRNEAPGLLHDVAIPDLGVEVPQIRAGESAEVTFTVPSTPGKHEYRCRPHGELMKGVVEVTP